jgi:hypothetical protein
MSIDLEQKRKAINMWLARDSLSRKDLANKLHVSEASVYNWLSCTNIPEKRWQEIKALFEPNEKPTPEPEMMRAVAVGFTSEELSDLKMIAGDKPLDVLLRELALERMNDILKKE